jgi:hypothetical protein
VFFSTVQVWEHCASPIRYSPLSVLIVPLGAGRSPSVATRAAFWFAALLAISTFQARADIIYDNGPPSTSNSPQDPHGLSLPVFVDAYCTQAFALSAPATVSSVKISLWANRGYDLGAVDWSIGSDAFSSTYSGTGTFTSYTPLEYWCLPDERGYQLCEATFDITTPISLQTDTNWLTLSAPAGSWNANFWAFTGSPTNSQTPIFWLYPPGGAYDYSYRPASFQLYGQTAPEPSTLALVGVGAIALCGWTWQRRRGAKA